MSEYKGSIELISGLKPKNNGNFPLMNAEDIAIYESVQQEDGSFIIEEKRLPQKLQSIGISQEDKDQLIRAAVAQAELALNDDIEGLGDRISSVSGNVSDLSSRIDNVEKQVGGDNKELKLQYEEKESTLYLYKDLAGTEGLIKPDVDAGVEGNVIAYTTIVGGGSAVAVSPYRLTLQKLNDLKTIRLGKTAMLNFFAKMVRIPTASEEAGEPVPVDKNLTFRVTVKTETKGTLTTIFKGDTNKNLSFDITPYLGLGKNEILLATSYTEDVITDTGESVSKTVSSSQEWNIKMIELSLESSFNDSNAFVNENAPWQGILKGDLNKTIHFEINGEPWKTSENHIDKQETFSMTIPFQGHGVHSLKVYLSAEIEGENGETVIETSDEFLYELLFIDKDNPTPVIRLKVSPSPMEQYTPGLISYTVYTTKTVNKNIVLKDNSGIIYSGVASNDAYERPYTVSDFGEKTITLTYETGTQTYEKSVDVLVNKSPYQINPVTTGLVLDFYPKNRSNSADDYNVFYNYAEELVDEDVAASLPEITWDFSDNFDWNNGGWQVDDEKNQYFCVKAGTSVNINYDPFLSSTIIKNGKASGTGREFKLIFKATNVGKPNATFLRCLDSYNVGLQMNAHEAYISSNEKRIYSPYSENDIIEFDFNIFPGLDTGVEMKPINEEIIPMTMTYEDGTPFQPAVHTLSTTYEHKTSVPITIGSPDCDIHIYRMKVYDRYLTDSEVLTNFIADARKGVEMVDRHVRNLIYDAGRLTPNSLAAARPDLKIIKITCPKFTNSKSDFQPMTSVEMIHRNGDPIQDNWKFEDCFIVGQGTTSNNYRDAGKNLEFICCFDGKYKNKKILNDYYGGDSEKYYAHRTKLTLNPNDDNPANRIDNSYDATNPESTGTGKIVLHKDAYPNNYFNVKVNIASSENANNALQANRYHRYLPYTTPAQKRDSRIKTTMDFVNCVVFLCETDPSGIEFPPSQEITTPADSDYHFYAIGNIGDSKKTDADRVYKVGDEKEFVLEIMDNDKPNAAFPTGFKTEANEFIYPITKEQWSSTDGYREVTDNLYLIDENLPVFYELIDGKYVLTSDETIDFSKTYYEVNYINPAYESLHVDKFRMTDEGPVQDSGWLASYEMRYGDDSTENIALWSEFYEWLITSSNTDFKAHFSDWFIQNAALYYFLFTERYTMMDNRAKNSFWHWAKHYITDEEAAEMGEEAKYFTINNEAAAIHNGYRFDFWDYDNDTALGIDNNGQIKFSYGLEDIDKNADGTFVFNAGNSVFFRRIRENFSNELTTVYGTTVKSEAWKSDHLINEYDMWQSEFPEALWLEDTKRKYYRTYLGKILNLPSLTQSWLTAHLTNRMQGRKKYHRRQWERDQADYIDSKYATSNAQNKSMLLRCKTPLNPVVPADYTWHLHPYKKMYLRTYRGEVLQDSIRALDLDKIYDLVGSTTSLEDAQLRVYSANCIQDFGDLSTFYAYSVEPGAGTEKVKILTVGNATEGYKNDNLTNVEVGTASILEKLNIQNLKGVTSVALVPSLQYLYAQGSGLTSATFTDGAAIREAYLPDTINTLHLRNLYYLNKLELDNYDTLENLIYVNTPGINSQNLVEQAINLKQIKILNIDWSFDDASVLLRLAKECNGFTEDDKYQDIPVLTGTVRVNSIRQSEIDAIRAVWPEDQLELIYDDENIIPQFELRFWKDTPSADSQPIFSKLVDYPYTLTTADDPSSQLIEQGILVKEATNQHTYSFASWDSSWTEALNKTITSDKDFYALWDSQVRSYTVTWYNDIEGVGLPIEGTSKTVEYGQSVTYEGELPLKIDPQKFNFYLFKEWDKSTGFIEENTSVYPIWDISSISVPDMDSTELSAVQIHALSSLGLGTDFDNKFIPDGGEISLELGYMPDYGGIPLIEEPITFDGTGSNAFVTEYKLFDEDKDFILAVDFTTNYSATKDHNVLVSCFNTSGPRGFRIYSPQINQVYSATGIAWNSVSVNKTIASKIPTLNQSYRDICVIRHKKGDSNLYVYTNNRFSLEEVQETILTNSNANSLIQNALGFGAQFTADGKPSLFGTGTIHYAKLWFTDLGVDECKKICSWTKDKITLSRCATRAYNISNSENTAAMTFVANYLLEQPVKFDANRNIYDGGWDTSDLREWLNNKVFAGISLPWQQIIKPVNLSSLYGSKSSAVSSFDSTAITTSDKLYIPSAADVVNLYNSNISSENRNIYLQEMNIGGNIYSVFTSDEDRARSYPDGKKGLWWTRTPNKTFARTQIVSNMEGSVSEKASYTETTEDGTQTTHYFYKDLDRIGVLLTFSIGEV